ncbi:MAG: FeoA family protein [Candidatus Thiodiazotropha sp.]|jgi:ferrous iron transport protein A
MDLKDLPTDQLIALARLPIGSHACIRRIQGGRQLTHRLLSLGLRVGSEIELTQRRGGGVVVANAGTRVALGAGVAEKLLVERLPDVLDKSGTA